MGELSVRPMTAAEFRSWEDGLVQAYAQEQTAAGNWPAEDAMELSRQENDALLPGGRETPGMLFLIAEDADLAFVGWLWISLIHPRGTPDCAYIYDIEVREQFRGRGFGRQLLAAADSAVLEHGVHSIMLNVFAGNAVAKGLYDSSGYRDVQHVMRKDLA